MFVKLLEKCSENIDVNQMLYNETGCDFTECNSIEVCHSCTIYILLFAVLFITSICLSSVFIYFLRYFKKDYFSAKFNLSTQTTIC